MGKTWTGTKEHSKLSLALLSAGSAEFPARVLPLLRSAFFERLGAAPPATVPVLGQEYLVWPTGQPSFLTACCLSLAGDEISEEQAQRCLQGIRSFRSSGLRTEVFLLIHSQDRQGKDFRDAVQAELQTLIATGQARKAELWNRQKVLQEAFDGMLRYTVSLLQERSFSAARFEDVLSEIAPLEQVPCRVSTLLIDQFQMKEVVEAVAPQADPADVLLDREEGRLSLLVGEFGLGKTTAVGRAAARTPGQLLSVAGARISREEVKGAKDYLIRCFDESILLAPFPGEEHATFRLLGRPAIEYVLKGNTDLPLAIVVDGVDESGILSRRGGFQHLFNMFREVRVPTLFTMRTEMWTDGRTDFASAFGLAPGHGERRNRKIRLVELLPWDEEQIRALIHRFRDSRPDAGERERLAALESLLDGGEFERLYGDIPRRPLFLRMILDTVAEEGLPRLRMGRARLLHDWVRWKIRRDIDAPLAAGGEGRAALVSGRETGATVEEVAWEAMLRAAALMVEGVEGILDLKPDCLLQPLLASSPRLARIVEPQALFLHSLLLPVGRETLGSPRRVRFAHRTFQEFFLAWCSLTEPEALPDLPPTPAVAEWARLIRDDKDLMDHDSIAERKRPPALAPTASPGAVQPPDLELRVKVIQDHGRTSLTYVLHSTKAAFHFDEVRGPVLTGSPDAFAAALFEKIEKLHAGSDTDGGSLLLRDAEKELASLGRSLYRELFPREMRTIYRRFREVVATLQITSDEPWIPWELIKPYDDDDGPVINDDFLCRKFQLTRWLAGGTSPAPVLPVFRLASIGADKAKDGKPLPNAVQEHALLAGLASRHPGLAHSSLPGAGFDDMESLLRRGDLGLLHFVGHGDASPERSNEAKIVLEDRPFRASNLTGEVQTAIKKNRPLVFLNACRVARQGWSLSGLGGWAEAWVRACGCGAFIGPQWVVKDSLAYEFARVFYQKLEAGETFGQAVTAAREAVWKKDPGRPTWLAYAAYGHPGARLAFGSGAGMAVEDRARVEVESTAADWPPAAPPRPVRTNAPAAPDIFLGRGRDVKQLKEKLGIGRDAATAPPVQVLTAVRGWPGVGKTSLAAFLANDPDIQTAFEGVLWASIGQEPDILGEMAAWGRWLGNNDLRQAANLKEAQAALRSLLRERRMVLVLDDVWSPAHAALFQSVGGPGCPVLLTTRETAIAQALASRPEAVHFLDVLDTDAAVDLLRTLAGDVVDQHPDACRRLVEDLEKLPLALQVAGRLLRKEATLDWGVDNLLRDLGDGSAILKASAPPDRIELDGVNLPTVSALFQRSTDRLSPEIRDRFRFLSEVVAKPATFGLDLLEGIWETDPKPTVRELVDRGLLEPAGDGRFQIHALLLQHAKTLAPPSAQ